VYDRRQHYLMFVGTERVHAIKLCKAFNKTEEEVKCLLKLVHLHTGYKYARVPSESNESN